LAAWIATEVLRQPENIARDAARAARLAKADLATDMVREFTELQGTMGGIYARDAGEPEAVWRAVYSHYLPVAVEADAAPTATSLGAAAVTWAAVSLADKLDAVVGLFLAGERPTGSRDPFGLRRSAHGILRLLLDAETLAGVRIRHSLEALATKAAQLYGEGELAAGWPDVWKDLAPFFTERVQHALEARGADRRQTRAVLAIADRAVKTPVADLADNVRALPEFSRSEPFRQLATAFKRVRNIARELTAEEFATLQQSPPDALLQEPAEKALKDELGRREAAIRAAAAAGKYRDAYAEAAQFEPAVARFFNDVFVMADDKGLRRARLWLLRRLEHLILELGDISEIVTTEP
jgi:glycyl-tRNA synthetase beta chain